MIACFDGDNAGRKASLRALEVFLHAGMLGRGVFIPTGFDPDTLVRERGAQALSELADAAEPLVDFFISEQARGAADENSRARAAERVAAILRWWRIRLNTICWRARRRRCSASARSCSGANRTRRDVGGQRPNIRAARLTARRSLLTRPLRPDASGSGKNRTNRDRARISGAASRIFSAAAAHLQHDPLWPLLQEICFSEEPSELIEAVSAHASTSPAELL